MHTVDDHEYIKVLVADDDEHVVRCYRDAFGEGEATDEQAALDALSAELFDMDVEIDDQPKFEVVACNQGEQAVDEFRGALDADKPFDVVILDVRMPPGVDGVEAGRRIREMDADVDIVFVTGYSDIPPEELERQVSPSTRLHYFTKPLSFARLADEVIEMVNKH